MGLKPQRAFAESYARILKKRVASTSFVSLYIEAVVRKKEVRGDRRNEVDGKRQFKT